MKSMTGMGRSEKVVQGAYLRLEIKSVNHRFCEVSVRLPGRYLPLEFQIHKLVKNNLSRGKVDLFLFEDKRAEPSETELKAFQDYHAYLGHVLQVLGMKNHIELRDLLNGVGSWMAKDVDVDALWNNFKPLVLDALNDLEKMREAEGASLATEMKSIFVRLSQIHSQILDLIPVVKGDLEKRLKTRLHEKKEELSGLDEQRLHTEVLLAVERMDITEELARLCSHLDQAKTFLSATGPIGRKFDFLLQEINREFNTIASKAQSSAIAHLVLDAKSELEKLKEQIQNVE